MAATRGMEEPVRDLVVDTHSADDRVSVIVLGEIDIATAPLLRAVLDGVCRSWPLSVEIDLSGGTFADSSGLAALIAARHRLAARGVPLSVRTSDLLLRRVFAATGLDWVFADADGSEQDSVLEPAG